MASVLAPVKKELVKLGEAFCCFKLVPRHYDEIVDLARSALERIRRHERNIMSTCVRTARMPRHAFLKEFPGHETSVVWINKHIKAKKNYSAKLEAHKDELLRSQKKLKQIEAAVGLTVAEIKDCLLYTSPSPRDLSTSRMPSSA